MFRRDMYYLCYMGIILLAGIVALVLCGVGVIG